MARRCGVRQMEALRDDVIVVSAFRHRQYRRLGRHRCFRHSHRRSRRRFQDLITNGKAHRLAVRSRTATHGWTRGPPKKGTSPNRRPLRMRSLVIGEFSTVGPEEPWAGWVGGGGGLRGVRVYPVPSYRLVGGGV